MILNTVVHPTPVAMSNSNGTQQSPVSASLAKGSSTAKLVGGAEVFNRLSISNAIRVVGGISAVFLLIEKANVSTKQFSHTRKKVMCLFTLSFGI